jgi:hypothetical protein
MGHMLATLKALLTESIPRKFAHLPFQHQARLPGLEQGLMADSPAQFPVRNSSKPCNLADDLWIVSDPPHICTRCLANQ